MSPAELFFGMDDSACSAMVSDLLQESDAEEQTDVPAEHSQDFTSEEERKERRSPSGETHRRSPAGIQSLGSVGLEFSRRPAPPGLTLLSTAAPGACGGLSSPSFPGCSPFTPMGLDASRSKETLASESDDEDDEADDERSHQSGEQGIQAQQLSAPPALSSFPGDGGVLDSANSLWYSELPSIGSANHFNGTCDRCCFHPKGRCLNGYNCQHCHFDHEKRKRKNKKKSKGMDQLSSSAEGGSVPVSPDRSFGPGGMLSQADFPPTPVSGMLHTAPEHLPASANTGFPPCQPTFFPGSSSAGRSACELGAEIDPNGSKWFSLGSGQLETLPLMPPMPSMPPMPPLQRTQDEVSSTAFAGGPPGFDYLSQPASSSPARGDAGVPSMPAGTETYIRQLEAENRYLRAYMLQYMGPGAGALLPPATPSAHPSQKLPLDVVGALQETSVALSGAAASRQQLTFGPTSFPAASMPSATNSSCAESQRPLTSHGLSPSAAPFWPSQTQAWAHQPVSGDASTRSGGVLAGCEMPLIGAAAPVQSDVFRSEVGSGC